MTGNLFGGTGGLRGELLDLAGDDRESLACIASARGFNGGIQRQQIGLGGDIADHVGDITDAANLGIQRLNRRTRLSARDDSPPDHGGRQVHLATDFSY